jgi:hypothetical protein
VYFRSPQEVFRLVTEYVQKEEVAKLQQQLTGFGNPASFQFNPAALTPSVSGSVALTSSQQPQSQQQQQPQQLPLQQQPQQQLHQHPQQQQQQQQEVTTSGHVINRLTGHVEGQVKSIGTTIESSKVSSAVPAVPN